MWLLRFQERGGHLHMRMLLGASRLSNTTSEACDRRLTRAAEILRLENQWAGIYKLKFQNRPNSKKESERRGPRSQQRILTDWCVNYISKAGMPKHARNATLPPRNETGALVPFESFIQRVSEDAQYVTEWDERGRNIDTVVAIEENVRRHRYTRLWNMGHLSIT